ncbi:hypothetical protein PLESTB_000468800 [Pleodorina starrii]|uniref:Phospholipid/glycerol acyltransferase domain-containing protein n=1 Tax=Pleodorina starrii TaxID=330485 RepID=A0A9W6BGC5_9CHLO|nr:hypothetical protein PLESTM_001598100 [Pleodorina starrii]GLC51127.1 hypothetical protein PLESTB_000468800 [Pleodorina starrii]
MPSYSKLQLLKLHYREFLRKTSAYHRSEGGDACAHTYYVERAWTESSFEDSFVKLSQALTTVNLSELRASYHSRKERAKERLRQAFDAKVSRLGRYLRNGDEAPAATANETVGPSSQRGAALDAASAQRQEPQPVASSSSSSTCDPDLQHLYGTDGVLRRTLLYLLGSAARAYMHTLNTTRVEGLDSMAAALQRPAGQALITVSNHVAALDDPLVVSALLPEGALDQPESIRWTLCASDRCFRYQALVPLFRAAKVLPVVRGGGLAQPGMAAAEGRLAAGDWVHIFPEGTRSPDGVSLGSVRKGVGRLVASVPPGGPPPLVVPFVHRGMEAVMPRGAVLPAVGQQIDVLVGDPIPVADLLAAARSEGWPADRLHTAVAARVGHGLQDLRRRLDALRAGQPDPGPSPPGPGPADDVSSLDQFDPADLTLAARLRAERRRGGAVYGTWERLKSRMALQHRSWAAAATAGGAAAAAEGARAPPVAAAAAAALQTGGGRGVVAVTAEGAGLGSWSSPYMRELLGLGTAQLGRAAEGAEGAASGLGGAAAGPRGIWWMRPAAAGARRGADPGVAF